MTSKVQFLKCKDRQLAYVKSEGKGPGVIFCGGFRSDMTGVKAVALEEFCAARGQQFIRFDYSGHGQSSGAFEDGTIGGWKDDVLAVLTNLSKGPQVLIGSSMGGWLSLLAAMEKPKRVCAIITIAAAPDFTEHMIRQKLTTAQKMRMEKKGVIRVASDIGEPYAISRGLIEEGRKHLLLDGVIPVACPVHLIHGMKDDDVPWEYSLALNEKLASQDVKLTLVEGGDHRLSEPKDIARLLRITEAMLRRFD